MTLPLDGGSALPTWVARARWVQRRVVDVAAVFGVLAVVVLLVGLLVGARPAVVVSGSMAPQVPVGSLVVARTVPAASVEVGDVVTVDRPLGEGLVTHRVVGTEPVDDGRTSLVLQGDANLHPDAVPVVAAEVSRVMVVAPVLGYVVLALQENLLPVVLLLAVGAVLVSVPVGGRGPVRRTRGGVSRGAG